ncbi:hypothetical protein L7F22_068241 [Adiantum nelumboides]|nr:hypothetical protein [Adiantum nelumboides]
MNTKMMMTRALRCNSIRGLTRQQVARMPVGRSVHTLVQRFASNPSLHQIQNAQIIHSRYLSVSAIRRQEEAEEEQREQTSGEKDIEEILSKEFSPKHLVVQDVSGGCGSFYSIVIASSKFKGITTVKAHRLVNAALKDIIKEIHGLQLRTLPADD